MGNTRVLVLDDEKYITDNLSAYLEDEGFSVIVANSAEEAMELLKTHEIDIGIIDIRLPGMDGDMFIKKAHNIWPTIKYIVHTGSPSYHLNESLAKVGITKQDIIHKPIEDMNTIVEAVNRKMTE